MFAYPNYTCLYSIIIVIFKQVLYIALYDRADIVVGRA